MKLQLFPFEFKLKKYLYLIHLILLDNYGIIIITYFVNIEMKIIDLENIF